MELNSEQAIAQAALEQNLTFASGYPGSPGGGVLTNIIESNPKQPNFHWSSNEKIAIEKAIGVAINEGNALVCVKSVGLNAMLDPLAVANLTPLTGSLVIIVGDDPGAYGSQNDQDSRLLATFLNLPWFEAISVQSSYNLVFKAFAISKSYGLPIFIRVTRYLAQQTAEITKYNQETRSNFLLNSIVLPRFVPGPSNAVAKNDELRNRMIALRDDLEKIKVNKLTDFNNSIGVIACGAIANKLNGIIQDHPISSYFDLLQLESVFPISENLIKNFISRKDKVLVLEENSPFILNQCKLIAQGHNSGSDWVSLAEPGELSGMEIANFLNKQVKGLRLKPPESEFMAMPAKTNPCNKSRYDEVLSLFNTISAQYKLNLKYYADPGCMVKVMDRLEGKFALGGSIATAFGANLSGSTALNIAFVGDSGLFHSAFQAVCDAIYNQAEIAIVFLNNNVALTTGGQSHPGSTTNGKEFDYQQLFYSAGVPNYNRINLDDRNEKTVQVITDYLTDTGLRLLQIDID